MYTYPLPSAALNELLVSNLSAFKIPVTIPNSGYFFTCPLENHCFFTKISFGLANKTPRKYYYYHNAS